MPMMWGWMLSSLMLATPPAFDVPAQWIHGAPGELPLQVHQAARDTWILRQGKASDFEAPFMYLVAGEHEALLLDSGAVAAKGQELPLRETVDRLLRERGGAKDADFPLIVAHSHGHGDHHANDAQFTGRPNTRVVGTSADEVKAFFHLEKWPDGEAQVDLGERVLTVIPLPGHEPAHIALYDATTQTLFSGDTVYPGMLTVRDLPAFRASVARLDAFAQSHEVARVLGAHIEMTREAGKMYPLESPFQPEEHFLALDRRHIHELHLATQEIGDFLADDVHDDFIIDRITKPSADKPSGHGMLVVGHDDVYLSHLPMFHGPHDYQLIFKAKLAPQDLDAYRADAAAHPDEMYTVDPTAQWVLPDTIHAGAAFEAGLYRGHFERGGTLLRKIRIEVADIVHFRHFETGRQARAQGWIAFGGGKEFFAAHRIEGPPDFDEIVQLDARPAAFRALSSNALRELRAGESIGDKHVARVLYTEKGDLAQP
jgi:glyoxylase-like metal-dependent hydrolase (beta-lactamase superfamily II)